MKLKTVEMKKISPCTCELTDIIPSRVYWSDEYNYVCLGCNGGVSNYQNDQWNQETESSGYDDVARFEYYEEED